MKSCMIVDDSQPLRKVVRRILERMDFACTEAGDGREACDMCREEGLPDLVLLDWHMPAMDGFAFLAHLRAMENGAAPKVVFCTSEDDPSCRRQALDSGADAYILKPFDSVAVRESLTQLGLLA